MKASLNRANFSLGELDPKPGDLTMGRLKRQVKLRGGPNQSTQQSARMTCG